MLKVSRKIEKLTISYRVKIQIIYVRSRCLSLFRERLNKKKKNIYLHYVFNGKMHLNYLNYTLYQINYIFIRLKLIFKTHYCPG